MTSLSSALSPLKIGMVGAGTVGGGVYEIIMGRLGGSTSKASAPTPATGFQNPSLRRCVISKICVRDLKKSRNFQIDESATEVVTDVKSIIEDDSIDMVVEVMGGTSLARTVVLESLKRGKSVVTANKALVAAHLDEIHETVLQSNGKVKIAFEAAVCGGIPIIQTLQGCFCGDLVNEVMGICNGTTNYMLGKMEEGADYEDVLKEAQELGYAEADPTADVEGHDVRAKIAILAKLAFGTTVSVNSIPCNGITEILPTDFEYAKLLGCTIKLVGTAVRLSKFGEHDGDLSVCVAPKLVPKSHFLASTRGCGNVVAIDTANLGLTSYGGPGAGRFPTANSVVADICRVANNTASADPFPLSSSIKLDHDYASRFYIRFSFTGDVGIIGKVGKLSGTCGVSINSFLQKPIKDQVFADAVITTEECKFSQVAALCKEISQENLSRVTPLVMPMLSDAN